MDMILWLILIFSILFNAAIGYWCWRCGCDILFSVGRIENASMRTADKATRIEATTSYQADLTAQRYRQSDEVLRLYHLSETRRYQISMQDTEPIPIVQPQVTWIGYPAMQVMQASGARQSQLPQTAPLFPLPDRWFEERRHL